MNVELSKNEIELLDTALQSWEKEPGLSAMFSSMLKLVLAPKEQEEEAQKSSENSMRAAEKETQSRRIKAVMIRAKLFQVLTRESEYDLST